MLAQSFISTGNLVCSDASFSIGKSAWSEAGKSKEERFKERAAELCLQASKFRKQVKAAADAFGKDKIAFSGKDGINQDDLIMVLIIGCYHIQRCFIEGALL